MPRSLRPHAGLLSLTLFISLPIFSFAQKAPPAAYPKYDLQTETKIKAVVQEVKLPAKPESKESAHLLVKNGEEMVDVNLCPKSFLDDMGVTFSKGDAVDLTISKIKFEGADLVLAREVTRGDDKLILRDDKGVPVWNWKR